MASQREKKVVLAEQIRTQRGIRRGQAMKEKKRRNRKRCGEQNEAATERKRRRETADGGRETGCTTRKKGNQEVNIEIE